MDLDIRLSSSERGGTILHGRGKPSNLLGENGDFYIDVDTKIMYGPKNITWGSGEGLKGKSADPVTKKVGDSLIITIPDIKGEKGDSVKGDPGENGVGIDSIEQDENRLVISLTDGRRKSFALKEGPKGESIKGDKGDKGNPGIGVVNVHQDEGFAVFEFSDGKKKRIPMPVAKDGVDGRELEVRFDRGWLQTRYAGEDDWKKLANFPNYGVSGGSGVVFLSYLSDVALNDPQNNDVLTYSNGKWINAPSAGGGVTTLNGLSGALSITSADSTVAIVAAGSSVDLSVLPGTSIVTLTDGATVALDASLGVTFRLTAAGDRTISAPTNPTDGQEIIIEHLASGAARLLTLATGAGAFLATVYVPFPLLQTAQDKVTFLKCKYRADLDRWVVLAENQST